MSSRPAVVVLTLLAGGVAVASATRDWASRRVPGLPDAAATAVTGRDVVPQVAALGLVIAAAAVVVGTGGRAVRTVAGAATVVAGAGIVAGVVPVLGGDGAIERLNGWAWVAVASGLVAVAAGGAGAALSRRWPGPTRRFELEVGKDAEADDGDPAEAWARLSRGDDPTRNDRLAQ